MAYELQFVQFQAIKLNDHDRYDRSQGKVSYVERIMVLGLTSNGEIYRKVCNVRDLESSDIKWEKIDQTPLHLSMSQYK